MTNRMRCTLALLLAMPVSALALCVGCSCSADVGTTNVSFGTYDPFGANLDVTGNVRVTCSGLVTLLPHDIPYTIQLDKGSYAASFNPRQMASGAYRLNYNLYADSARGTIWGDGTGGTSTVPGTVQLPALGIIVTRYMDNTVYGRIPGSQTTVHAGSYIDTITVTVTYTP